MNNNPDYYGKYLKPGTYVRRESGGSEGEILTEYGIVVYCWMNAEIDMYDCYIAFYGHSMPIDKEELEEPAYILRYASTSLTVVNENGEPDERA